MSENIPNKRVIGLDIARAAAVLGVLLTHLTIRWYTPYPFMRIALLFIGMMGVELFFVLSGFLIGGILLRQAQREPFTLPHVPRFWMRRWFRTLPNYYLFLGLLALLFPNPARGQLRFFLVFAQNLFSARSDWFVVSWSLCIEECMYLLLPIVLLLFTRLVRHPQRAAKGAIATLLIVPTLLRLGTYGLQWDSGVRHVVIYKAFLPLC